MTENELRELVAKRICYAFYSEGWPAAGDGKLERIAQKLAGLPFPLGNEDLVSTIKRAIQGGVGAN